MRKIHSFIHLYIYNYSYSILTFKIIIVQFSFVHFFYLKNIVSFFDCLYGGNNDQYKSIPNNCCSKIAKSYCGFRLKTTITTKIECKEINKLKQDKTRHKPDGIIVRTCSYAYIIKSLYILFSRRHRIKMFGVQVHNLV